MTSHPIRTVIVDDEPVARELIRIRLEREPDFEIVGEAASGPEAVAAVARELPHLLFLDIQMPGMTGFQALDAMASNHLPHVVFVTAFDQFAVAAFEVAAVDYVMKPVDPARLDRALDRARVYLATRGDAQGAPSSTSRYLEEFWASDLSGLVRIATRDIDRVSAERDYMRLHVGQRSWLIHHSMNALEEGLDPAQFIRLHRSAIVRRDFVTGFSRNASGRWIARLADASEQPVGRLYSDAVREMSGR